MEKKTPLKLIKNDKWLEPFAPAIEGRYYSVLAKKSELTNRGKKSLSDLQQATFILGYIVLQKVGCSVNGLPMQHLFV